MRSGKIRPKVLALAVLCALPMVSMADNAPLVPSSGQAGVFYYELGGGNDSPMPAFLDTNTIPLTVGGNTGLGYNCGVFNPKLSIENAINGIKNSAMNMEQSVINNATGAIYDMPLYLIARANHTAYDMLTNQFFNAQTQLQVSTKSCQVMQAEMARGQNPYTNWATIAMGNDWQKHMSLSFSARSLGDSGGQDINEVKQEVAQDNGKNGVPWIHGANASGGGSNAGGEGQPTIQVIHDAVVAGYNVLLQSGRNYDDESAPGKTPQNAYLVQTWASPADAAKWIVNVVGDQEITTYPGGAKRSTPGVGLLPDVYEQTQIVQKQLVNLIDGSTSITVANLQALASPSMVLNKQAVQAFQKLDSVDQTIYVHKLAQAISAERVAEKVRLAKQLFMVGMSVPAIFSNKAAKTDINNAIKKLDDYRNSMTFGNGKIFGSAAKVVQAVMAQTSAAAQQSATIQPSANPGLPLENGAIAKQGS